MSELEITKITPYVIANPWKPWVFVRVDTNGAVHGVGEATYSIPGHESIVATIEMVEENFIGTDPFQTELLAEVRDVRGAMSSPNNIILASAVASIEMACWDIKGKVLDRPLYDLLGGYVQGTSLPVYANGWYTDVYEDGVRSPDLFAEAATNVVEDGYDGLKFDPFGTARQYMRRDELNRSVEIVEAVREAIGSDIDLFIEGHQRFNVATALDVANKIAPYDPTFFEEPVPPDLNTLRKVSAKSPVTIATGEAHVTHHAFADLLSNTDVGIVQPDFVRAGGVGEGKKIAAMASAENVSVAPHNDKGPVGTAVSAHIAASISNFAILEVFEDYAQPEWVDELVTEPFEITNGYIHIPDEPGLGITLNESALRKYEYNAESETDVERMDIYNSDWETRTFENR